MEDNTALILHTLHVRLLQAEAILDWLAQRQRADQLQTARHALITATDAVREMRESAAGIEDEPSEMVSVARLRHRVR